MATPSKREIEQAIASIQGKAIPPDANPDAEVLAKFVQGALAGTGLRAMAGDQDALPIKIRNVEVPQDSNGDYLDHFILTTESGIRLRVTVEPEESK